MTPAMVVTRWLRGAREPVTILASRVVGVGEWYEHSAGQSHGKLLLDTGMEILCMETSEDLKRGLAALAERT